MVQLWNGRLALKLFGHNDKADDHPPTVSYSMLRRLMDMYIILYKQEKNKNRNYSSKSKLQLMSFSRTIASKAYKYVHEFGDHPKNLARVLTNEGFLEYLDRLCQKGYLDVQLGILNDRYTDEDHSGRPTPHMVPMSTKRGKKNDQPLFYVVQILNAMSPTYLQAVQDAIDDDEYIITPMDNGKTGNRFTRLFSSISAGMKVGRRLFNPTHPTPLEKGHLLIANLLSSCYNDYLNDNTSEKVYKSNIWTTGQKVVAKTENACYDNHSDSDITLNSRKNAPFFTDCGQYETRLPYPEEQQTITFCFNNGDDDAIVVTWYEKVGNSMKSLGQLVTPNNSIHWQLAGSQLYEHGVSLKKGACPKGNHWRMIISFRMLLDPAKFPQEYANRVIEAMKVTAIPQPFIYHPYKPLASSVGNYLGPPLVAVDTTTSPLNLPVIHAPPVVPAGKPPSRSSTVVIHRAASGTKRSAVCPSTSTRKKNKVGKKDSMVKKPYQLGTTQNTDRWKLMSKKDYLSLGLRRPGTITELDTPMENYAFHPVVVRKYLMERNVWPQREVKQVMVENGKEKLKIDKVDVLYSFRKVASKTDKVMVYPGMLVNKGPVVADGRLGHSNRRHEVWNDTPGSDNVMILSKTYKNNPDDIKRLVMNEDLDSFIIYGMGGSATVQGACATNLDRDSRDDTNYMIHTCQKLGSDKKSVTRIRTMGTRKSGDGEDVPDPTLEGEGNDSNKNTNDVFVRFTRTDKIVCILVDPTEFGITSVWNNPGDGKTIIGTKSHFVGVGYFSFHGYQFDSLTKEEIEELEILVGTSSTDNQWLTFLEGKHYSFRMKRVFRPEDYKTIANMSISKSSFDYLLFKDEHMSDKFRVEIPPECKNSFKGVKEGEGWGGAEMYNAFVDLAQYVPYLEHGYRYSHEEITIRDDQTSTLTQQQKHVKMKEWYDKMPTYPSLAEMDEDSQANEKFMSKLRRWEAQRPRRQYYKSVTANNNNVCVVPSASDKNKKAKKGTRSTPSDMNLSLAFSQAACNMRILRNNIVDDNPQGTAQPLTDTSLGFILRTHPFASPNRTLEPHVWYQRLAAMQDLHHKPKFGELIANDDDVTHFREDFGTTLFRAVFSRVAGRASILYLYHLWADSEEPGKHGLLPTRHTYTKYFDYLRAEEIIGSLTTVQKMQHTNFVPKSMRTFVGLEYFFTTFCSRFDKLVDELIPSTRCELSIEEATIILANTIGQCSNTKMDDCYWLSQTILADQGEIYDLVQLYNGGVSVEHVRTGFGGKEGYKLLNDEFTEEESKRQQKKLEASLALILQDVGTDKVYDEHWLAANGLYADEKDKPATPQDLWLPRHIVNGRLYSYIDVEQSLCKCGILGNHTLGSYVLSEHPIAAKPWFHPIRFRDKKDVLNDLCPEYMERIIKPGIEGYKQLVQGGERTSLPNYCRTRVEVDDADMAAGKPANAN